MVKWFACKSSNNRRNYRLLFYQHNKTSATTWKRIFLRIFSIDIEMEFQSSSTDWNLKNETHSKQLVPMHEFYLCKPSDLGPNKDFSEQEENKNISTVLSLFEQTIWKFTTLKWKIMNAIYFMAVNRKPLALLLALVLGDNNEPMKKRQHLIEVGAQAWPECLRLAPSIGSA